MTKTAICQITDELRDEPENTFWQLLKILLLRHMRGLYDSALYKSTFYFALLSEIKHNVMSL